MSSVFASVAVPLFFCVWDPLSCQRVVFFGREEGMTSTGVVITMRTLLNPDYTDFLVEKKKKRKSKSKKVEKILWGVAHKI